MNRTDAANAVIGDHCNDLSNLTSLLMRSAAGGTGADQIGAALLKAMKSLEALEAAITRKEVIDFGLCKRIASELQSRAFPDDCDDFDSLLSGGINAGMKVAAYRMGGAMGAHVSRATNDLRAWALYFEEDRKTLLKRMGNHGF